MEYAVPDGNTARILLRLFHEMKENAEALTLCGVLDLTDTLDDRQAFLLRNALNAYDLAVRNKTDILERLFPGSQVPEEIPVLDETKLKELRKVLRQKEAKTTTRKLYISDLHFYHHALNKQMDLRGFSGYREMNEHIISQWNQKVNAKDEVYILGDLSIAKGKATNEILRQLKGKLFLIEGNHDRFLKDKEFEADRFRWIKPYAEINDSGRKVILSHYPVFCYNGQYKKEDGVPYVYMLYGHVHDTYDEVLINRFIRETREASRISRHSGEEENIPCNMINCFCMFSDYQPQTLDEWIETDRTRREKMNREEAERSQDEQGT